MWPEPEVNILSREASDDRLRLEAEDCDSSKVSFSNSGESDVVMIPRVNSECLVAHSIRHVCQKGLKRDSKDILGDVYKSPDAIQ